MMEENNESLVEAQASECLCPCHLGHVNFHCFPACCEDAGLVVARAIEVEDNADTLTSYFGII